MPADEADAANTLILDAALTRACSSSRRHVIESALAMLPPVLPATLAALCDLCCCDLLKGGCDVTSISDSGVAIAAIPGADGAVIAVGVSASWGVCGRWGGGCGVCGVCGVGEGALKRGELAGWSSSGGGARKLASKGCDFSKSGESGGGDAQIFSR